MKPLVKAVFVHVDNPTVADCPFIWGQIFESPVLIACPQDSLELSIFLHFVWLSGHLSLAPRWKLIALFVVFGLIPSDDVSFLLPCILNIAKTLNRDGCARYFTKMFGYSLSDAPSLCYANLVRIATLRFDFVQYWLVVWELFNLRLVVFHFLLSHYFPSTKDSFYIPQLEVVFPHRAVSTVAASTLTFYTRSWKWLGAQLTLAIVLLITVLERWAICTFQSNKSL